MSDRPVLGNLSPLIPAGDDVDATITFYERQFGFTTVHKEGDPTEMAIVKRDAVEIFLFKNDDRHVSEQTAFRIHVEHIEALYEEYQAKDVIHQNGRLDEKPWATKEFGVLDPTGVCITFYEPVAQ